METSLTALFCMASFLLGAVVSGGLKLPEKREGQPSLTPDDPLSQEIGLLLRYNPLNSGKAEDSSHD